MTAGIFVEKRLTIRWFGNTMRKRENDRDGKRGTGGYGGNDKRNIAFAEV